jgi:hypothetical protein
MPAAQRPTIRAARAIRRVLGVESADEELIVAVLVQAVLDLDDPAHREAAREWLTSPDGCWPIEALGGDRGQIREMLDAVGVLDAAYVPFRKAQNQVQAQRRKVSVACDDRRKVARRRESGSRSAQASR